MGSLETTIFQDSKAGPDYFRRPSSSSLDIYGGFSEHEFPLEKMERLQKEAELLKPMEQAELLLMLCDQLKLNERLVEQDDMVGRLRLKYKLERQLKEVLGYYTKVRDAYNNQNFSETRDIPGAEEIRLAERITRALYALGANASVEQATFITVTESGTVRSAVQTEGMDYSAYKQDAARAVNLVLAYLERHHPEIISKGKTALAAHPSDTVPTENPYRRLALEGMLNAFAKTEATSVYQEPSHINSERWRRDAIDRERMQKYMESRKFGNAPKMTVEFAWQMQGGIDSLSVQDKQKLLNSVAKRLQVEFTPSAA